MSAGAYQPAVSLDLVGDPSLASMELHDVGFDQTKVEYVRINGVWFIRVIAVNTVRRLEEQWREALAEVEAVAGTIEGPGGTPAPMAGTAVLPKTSCSHDLLSVNGLNGESRSCDLCGAVLVWDRVKALWVNAGGAK